MPETSNQGSSGKLELASVRGRYRAVAAFWNAARPARKDASFLPSNADAGEQCEMQPALMSKDQSRIIALASVA